MILQKSFYRNMLIKNFIICFVKKKNPENNDTFFQNETEFMNSMLNSIYLK